MADELPRWLADRRYELLEPLGSGGTATVYRCMDHTLQVERAIKVLKGAVRDRWDLQKRMETEARVLASIRHPGVVPIYDFGHDQGVDYLVTELIRGETVQQRVREHGPMAPATAARWISAVLRALAAAHAHGVVHRDVKPSNILLDPSGPGGLTPRLIDFGIARAPNAQRMTAAGMAMGTLAFMAPEQRLDASSVGPEADIHAAGASLFWMVTGASPMDLAYAEADDPRWQKLPAALRPIVARSLQMEPEDRYRSADTMADALDAVIGALGAEVGGDQLRLEASLAALRDAVDAGRKAEAAIRQHGWEVAALASAAGIEATWSGPTPWDELERATALVHQVERALAEPTEVALLVGSEGAWRAEAAGVLEGAGHRVVVVDSEAAALDALNRCSPRLAVVVMDAPGPAELALLRTVRAILGGRPVLAVCGAPWDAAVARRSGVTELVTRGELGLAVARVGRTRPT